MRKVSFTAVCVSQATPSQPILLLGEDVAVLQQSELPSAISIATPRSSKHFAHHTILEWTIYVVLRGPMVWFDANKGETQLLSKTLVHSHAAVLSQQNQNSHRTLRTLTRACGASTSTDLYIIRHFQDSFKNGWRETSALLASYRAQAPAVTL